MFTHQATHNKPLDRMGRINTCARQNSATKKPHVALVSNQETLYMYTKTILTNTTSGRKMPLLTTSTRQKLKAITCYKFTFCYSANWATSHLIWTLRSIVVDAILSDRIFGVPDLVSHHSQMRTGLQQSCSFAPAMFPFGMHCAVCMVAHIDASSAQLLNCYKGWIRVKLNTNILYSSQFHAPCC